MIENKGDLISRETLKKALKSNCTPELCHDYNTNWCERCCRYNDFEDLIDNAPTVEKPQGKWVWIAKSTNIQLEPDCIMCSNCSFMFYNATPFARIAVLT